MEKKRHHERDRKTIYQLKVTEALTRMSAARWPDGAEDLERLRLPSETRGGRGKRKALCKVMPAYQKSVSVAVQLDGLTGRTQASASMKREDQQDEVPSGGTDRPDADQCHPAERDLQYIGSLLTACRSWRGQDPSGLFGSRAAFFKSNPLRPKSGDHQPATILVIGKSRVKKRGPNLAYEDIGGLKSSSNAYGNDRAALRYPSFERLGIDAPKASSSTALPVAGKPSSPGPSPRDGGQFLFHQRAGDIHKFYGESEATSGKYSKSDQEDEHPVLDEIDAIAPVGKRCRDVENGSSPSSLPSWTPEQETERHRHSRHQHPNALDPALRGPGRSIGRSSFRSRTTRPHGDLEIPSRGMLCGRCPD